MKLEYKPNAIKQLKNLPRAEQKKAIQKLAILGEDPMAGKMLKGEFEGLYSFRAWPYRIIYTISDDAISIESIKHRQSAYK